MACASVVRPRQLALVALCFATLSTLEARAEDRIVIPAETPVRSAPFDVAPEIARLHAGDRVGADDQAQGPWRRIALPDGRHGFVRDADTQPAEQLPVSIQPAAGATSAPMPAQSTPVVGKTVEPSAPPAGPHLLGVAFELLPVGTLAGESNGNSASADSIFAVGVAPFVDGALSPYLALGLSPQMIFRVRSDGSMSESAKELDLRVRLTGRLPLSPRVRAFLRLSPAYSIIFLPSPPSNSASPAPANPQGFLIGGSVGVEVAVLPNLFVVSDVGYQAGFQSSADGDLHTSYLHLGAGFAIGL